jgi:acetyl esterase/lipase
MTHPIVGLLAGVSASSRATLRGSARANDPADLPRESVVLSNASGLSTLITEESERIIPTLRATAATDDLSDKMRLLGDALRTAGTPAVRDALDNLTGALQMYEGMTRTDAAAAAELGALKLAVDAVREALQPVR